MVVLAWSRHYTTNAVHKKSHFWSQSNFPFLINQDSLTLITLQNFLHTLTHKQHGLLVVDCSLLSN